jgi:hypothetical protein
MRLIFPGIVHTFRAMLLVALAMMGFATLPAENFCRALG